MEISTLKPLLDANDVKLVGIGLEELGLDEFVKGDYFKGDLYVDVKQRAYRALGYRRYNICTIIMSLFYSKSRAAISKARAENLDGDLKGDGLQNGGTLIIKRGGGEVLLSYRQEGPAEHIANSEILEALRISDSDDIKKTSSEDETKIFPKHLEQMV